MIKILSKIEIMRVKEDRNWKARGGKSAIPSTKSIGNRMETILTLSSVKYAGGRRASGKQT